MRVLLSDGWFCKEGGKMGLHHFTVFVGAALVCSEAPAAGKSLPRIEYIVVELFRVIDHYLTARGAAAGA